MTQPLVNQTSDRHSSDELLEPDEISLIDILRFLRRQLPVIGGTTLAMVLVGIAASLLSPPEFRREILLDFEIASRLENEGITVDESAIEALALFDLQNHLKEYQTSSESSSNISGSIESASMGEASELPTHLRISLRASEPEILENFYQSAYNRLQASTNNVVREQLETEIERLDSAIERKQNRITFLREQMEAFATSPALGGNGEILALLRLQEQQSALVQELGDLASQQFDRQNLVEVQAHTDSLIELMTLADIQTQQSTPLRRNLVLSVVVGLMLGILIGVVVDQISHLRKGLKKTSRNFEQSDLAS